MTNTSLLKALFAYHGLTVTAAARMLGLPRGGLSAKIHNRTEFKAHEINTLVKLLHIPTGTRLAIFFTNEQKKAG